MDVAEGSSFENSFVKETNLLSSSIDPSKVIQVQKDLDFLNLSWENMVHNEERKGIGDSLSSQSIVVVDIDGFQLVKSKSKKKSQNKKATRSNYIISATVNS